MRFFLRIIHSRLFMIWAITLVSILIALSITLLLISRSKQTQISDAPPKLPDSANPMSKLLPVQYISLFLLDPAVSELIPVQVELQLYSESTKRLKQIVTALIKETLPNYRNPIPRGTILNEAYIDSQKTAYLDFSYHLTDGQIGGTTAEFLTVTSILKTVFNAFPDKIKHVQILINGEERETLAGHLNISQPLRF